MKRALTTPALWWTLGIFTLYLATNVLVSNFTTTLRTIPYYLDTLNWPALLGSLTLTIIIAALVALNTTQAYLRYQDHKRNATVACTASAAGLLIGVCPLCTASLLPVILSAIGITFTWTLLPFNGIELQSLLIIILLLNLRSLRQ